MQAVPVVPISHPSLILNHFAQAAQQWEPTIVHAALFLYVTFAVIDLAWAFVSKAHQNYDLPSILAMLQGKILRHGIFIGFMTLNWPQLIIDSFIVLGQKAASLNPATITPSAILTDGANIMSALYAAAANSGGMFSQITSLPYTIAGLFILAAFGWMAYHYVLFMVETYIVMFGGMVMLGFGAIEEAGQYAERYLTMLISAGLRIMTFFLLIGVAHGLAAQWWMADAQAAPLNVTAGIENSFIIAIECFLFAGLCHSAPALIGSVLQGSVSLSAHNVVGMAAPIARGAMTMAGIAVTGGIAGTAAAGAAARTAPGMIGNLARAAGGFGGSAGGSKPKQPGPTPIRSQGGAPSQPQAPRA